MTRIKASPLGLGLVLAVCFCTASWASEPDISPQREQKNLDTQIQDLKREVLKINRELFSLEEELLFPSSTQVAVFLSLDVGEYFKLDSVQLKIDDKVVTNYLYTKREVEALARGGIQRLYTGNLKTGDHEIVALFIGKGPQQRDYKRATKLTMNKTLKPKFLELKIIDNENKQQPDFAVEEW